MTSRRSKNGEGIEIYEKVCDYSGNVFQHPKSFSLRVKNAIITICLLSSFAG